jgi:hypothetical protein
MNQPVFVCLHCAAKQIGSFELISHLREKHYDLVPNPDVEVICSVLDQVLAILAAKEEPKIIRPGLN